MIDCLGSGSLFGVTKHDHNNYQISEGVKITEQHIFIEKEEGKEEMFLRTWPTSVCLVTLIFTM